LTLLSALLHADGKFASGAVSTNTREGGDIHKELLMLHQQESEIHQQVHLISEQRESYSLLVYAKYFPPALKSTLAETNKFSMF